MTNCRAFFFCIPNYVEQTSYFSTGRCHVSRRKVLADMTACSLYQERRTSVAVKSTPKRRNTYMGTEGNAMKGVSLEEVLDKPLTILVKREYTWGKYTGLAVKVQGENGKFAVIEITAKLLIKKLTDKDFPKLPVKGHFTAKVSKNKRIYYTFVQD